MKTKHKPYRLSQLSERIAKPVLFLTALTAVFITILIAFFIFKQGLPVLDEFGVMNILTGKVWQPTKEVYGILPMRVGTFYVTFLALLIGVPFGLATAIFLAELATEKTVKIVRPAIELLAGIPSVIYGLFGMVVINEAMRFIEREILASVLPENYRWGYSILSGSIVLAIMILPTIINISEDAIKAVPRTYKEGALALGSTHIQTIFQVLLPAAKSGILSAVILAMGRALGETMALIMVIGNVTMIPQHGIWSLFAPASTLTGTIALEMGYAAPEHRAALFMIGVVLFCIIALLNAFTILAARKGVSK
jgi:phosphate transport system permease protein